MTTQLTLSLDCLTKEQQAALDRDIRRWGIGLPPLSTHGQEWVRKHTPTTRTFARPLKPANASINND